MTEVKDEMQDGELEFNRLFEAKVSAMARDNRKLIDELLLAKMPAGVNIIDQATINDFIFDVLASMQVTAILQNPEIQENFAEEVLAEMEAKRGN